LWQQRSTQNENRRKERATRNAQLTTHKRHLPPNVP
jgi:hypothetical protein